MTTLNDIVNKVLRGTAIVTFAAGTALYSGCNAQAKVPPGYAPVEKVDAGHEDMGHEDADHEDVGYEDAGMIDGGNVDGGDVNGGDAGTELAQYCEPCNTMEDCASGACVDYAITPAVEGFCLGTPNSEGNCSDLESSVLDSEGRVDYCASTNACGTLNSPDGGSQDVGMTDGNLDAGDCDVRNSDASDFDVEYVDGGVTDAGDADAECADARVECEAGTLCQYHENLCSDGTAYVSIPADNATELTGALAYTVNSLEDGCEGSGQGVPIVTGTLEGNVPADAKELALGIDDTMTDSYCITSEEKSSGNYKAIVIGKDASSVQAGVDDLLYNQQDNSTSKCE